jgi:hypothetical protein
MWAIRVSHKAGRKRGKGRNSPRYLLRCGCCEQRLLIPHFDEALAGKVYAVESEIEENFDDRLDFYVPVGDYRRLQPTLPRQARVQLLDIGA